MSALIDRLNCADIPLLPPEVKDNLVRQFDGEPTKCPRSAAVLLATWCVESMPSIAAYHGVKLDQVIDSLQHYRFGFRQAQNLVSAHGEVSFDPELVGIFTIVHDLGRMMAGICNRKSRNESRKEVLRQT